MRLAIVIPWFSEAPSGGAERHAGALVANLISRGHEAELFTTCARDPFHDWGENYYPAGLQTVADLPVRRFPVRKRNRDLYNRVHGKMLAGGRLAYVEELQWHHETINSDEMLQYIAEHGDEYVFIFLAYLYGTTYWGMQVRSDRSFLMPCLHDEPYAYMQTVKDMLNAAAGALFLSEPEMLLAQRITGIAPDRSHVAGGGVGTDAAGDAERARLKFGVKDPYLLYVGRKVAGKNVKFILDCFDAYKQHNPGSLKLVLAGTGDLAEFAPDIARHPDIVDLGSVEEQDKYDLIKGSIALCQPSLMESFSIVLMEAWLMETPVLVHRDGQVTSHHCEVSGGGFVIGDHTDFEQSVERLLRQKDLRAELGRKGRQYVVEKCGWDNVIPRLVAVLKRYGQEVQA